MSSHELDKQYRRLDQTLSMHAKLRDRYAWRALILDVALLACAVVFCATTFVPDSEITKLGLSPETVHLVLGVASVVAFLGSVLGLRVDWKGKEARHRDAAQKLAEVKRLFSGSRGEDKLWHMEKADDLHRAYWEAANSIIEVPEREFLSLKAGHRRKVEISRMLDTMPGVPVFFLRILLFFRSLKMAFGTNDPNDKESTNAPNSVGALRSDASGQEVSGSKGTCDNGRL